MEQHRRDFLVSVHFTGGLLQCVLVCIWLLLCHMKLLGAPPAAGCGDVSVISSRHSIPVGNYAPGVLALLITCACFQNQAATNSAPRNIVGLCLFVGFFSFFGGGGEDLLGQVVYIQQ